MAQNQITQLPPDVFNIPELQTLDVAENKITELSADVGKLKNLTNLFVQGNKIGALPATLKDLPDIKRITLTGNPIVTTDADTAKLLGELKAMCEKNGGKMLGPEKEVAAGGGKAKFSLGKFKAAGGS